MGITLEQKNDQFTVIHSEKGNVSRIVPTGTLEGPFGVKAKAESRVVTMIDETEQDKSEEAEPAVIEPESDEPQVSDPEQVQPEIVEAEMVVPKSPLEKLKNGFFSNVQIDNQVRNQLSITGEFDKEHFPKLRELFRLIEKHYTQSIGPIVENSSKSKSQPEFTMRFNVRFDEGMRKVIWRDNKGNQQVEKIDDKTIASVDLRFTLHGKKIENQTALLDVLFKAFEDFLRIDQPVREYCDVTNVLVKDFRSKRRPRSKN